MFVFFFFQAEDGIRYLVRSRGLGDVYKRQLPYPSYARQLILKPEIFIALITYDNHSGIFHSFNEGENWSPFNLTGLNSTINSVYLDDNQTLYACTCLLYTSDAADERSSVDLGGRRIIKKKTHKKKNKEGSSRKTTR